MQRDRLARRDVPADHGPGLVVDDHAGDPAEVGERPPVARPERRQVLAGGEAAERVPRVRQHHVEGVDLRDPGMGEDAALVAPVDLGLRSRDHLEPAVQPRQLRRRIAQLGRDPGPGLLQVHLDPLVVPGEPVLPGQPFVDDGALQQDLGAQPRVDHRAVRRDDLPAPACARRRLRRRDRAVLFQVLLDGPPVQPGLTGDLRQARSGLPQRPEPAQLKPPLRFQHHPAAPRPRPLSEHRRWSQRTHRVTSRHAAISACPRVPSSAHWLVHRQTPLAVAWKWLPRSHPAAISAPTWSRLTPMATAMLPSTIRARGMGAVSSSRRAPVARSTMTPMPAKVQVSGMSRPTVPTMTNVL